MTQQLDQALAEISQRIQSAGSQDTRTLVAAIGSIHTVATQMSQDNGDDSSYSKGVADMAGTVLHLLTVSLTNRYPHLAPDTTSA
ncbi:hypothetical protein GCM10009720_16290 [Yaniella flava]|uniref:Uncharacterized protein n=1 Tax=Yaniella flava TaxID=287930 RepID=A0ABN2UHD2_9MICC|nr:hypothetical protein [Micrococcaceae bacterium]